MMVMDRVAPYRRRPALTQSAVSDEAHRLRLAEDDVEVAVEQSIALSGKKTAARTRIYQLASEGAVSDWDGEGGTPISARTMMNAIDFLRALPRDVPMPEFALEPDGSISMDWIKSRQQILSVSINERNRLPYAWRDGADRGHAVAQFDGATIPSLMLQGIRSIMRAEWY